MSSQPDNPTPTAATREALELCQAEGFTLAGVAPLTSSPRGRQLRDWLAAGKHGEMTWLADTADDRVDPERLLPGATSVVMVADRYAERGQPEELPVPGHGRIARYARGRDYHETIKGRLHRVCDTLRARHPGTKARAFCDTAPVHERELAAACGLGWIGKHTLLIHPTLGSWLLLGGFLTTLELEPPADQHPETDHCGSCTRCIDACPTDAITPYSVDASRCISYLTIEHQSPIKPELADKLGDWLFGCDVCQEVCPHNSVPRQRAESGGGATAPRADYAPRRTSFDLLDLLSWDEPTRRGRFSTSAMKRVTLPQVKRNAINLLPLDRSRARIRELAWDAHEDPLVIASARAVLGRDGGV